jgi:hypothetical protein
MPVGGVIGPLQLLHIRRRAIDGADHIDAGDALVVSDAENDERIALPLRSEMRAIEPRDLDLLGKIAGPPGVNCSAGVRGTETAEMVNLCHGSFSFSLG